MSRAGHRHRARWHHALALCAVGSSLAVAHAQHVGGVTGHVYSAETNQPLRFATVTLQATTAVRGQGDGSSGGSTQTDLTGAFTLTGVQPGTYFVVGRMPGYVTSAPNPTADTDLPSSDQRDPPLSTVRVEENQTTPVEVRLDRGASLGGTVHFEDGSPATGLEVRLYQKSSSSGWQTVTSRGGGSTGRTDDRGRFRIAGLRPGTYAAEVSLPAPAAPQPGVFFRVGAGRGGAGQSLRVYSGNVFRLKLATGIALGGTDDRTDVDVDIPLSGLHIVHGDIAAASSGHTVGQGTVDLLDPDDRSLLRSTSILAGGSFTLDNVPPGDYLIRVEGRPDRTSNTTGIHFAPFEQPLKVDGDLTTLAYTLTEQQ